MTGLQMTVGGALQSGRQFPVPPNQEQAGDTALVVCSLRGAARVGIKDIP